MKSCSTAPETTKGIPANFTGLTLNPQDPINSCYLSTNTHEGVLEVFPPTLPPSNSESNS